MDFPSQERSRGQDHRGRPYDLIINQPNTTDRPTLEEQFGDLSGDDLQIVLQLQCVANGSRIE
jgi:hypothetical protein